MIRDTIVDEVRQNRKATEIAHGSDWKKLIEHYRQIQNSANRIVCHEPKRISHGAVDRAR